MDAVTGEDFRGSLPGAVMRNKLGSMAGDLMGGTPTQVSRTCLETRDGYLPASEHVPLASVLCLPVVFLAVPRLCGQPSSSHSPGHRLGRMGCRPPGEASSARLSGVNVLSPPLHLLPRGAQDLGWTPPSSEPPASSSAWPTPGCACVPSPSPSGPDCQAQGVLSS